MLLTLLIACHGGQHQRAGDEYSCPVEDLKPSGFEDGCCNKKAKHEHSYNGIQIRWPPASSSLARAGLNKRERPEDGKH